MVRVALAGALFVGVTAHLYGATMALSPRDGVQPIEFMDEAFYSVLGEDLANTGTESTLSPSGLSAIAGTAPQQWYHWGEIWLAAAAIDVFDAEAIPVRHFLVLPLLLLSMCALTGTLVRRVHRTKSPSAFLLGFFACAFLAPIPLLPGPHFSNWAVGFVFGVTTYGLGAVAVLLSIVLLILPNDRDESWQSAAFRGSAIAFTLPAHVVLAAVSCVGLAAAVLTHRVGDEHRRDRSWFVSRRWRRTAACATAGVLGGGVWGLLTGHTLAAAALSDGVQPFNDSWRVSLSIIALGAGSYYAVLIALVLVRNRPSEERSLYVATVAAVAIGLTAWGARLGDFNMFHAFFGAVACFATPAAAVAVWSVMSRAGKARVPWLRLIVGVLVVFQIEFGVLLGGLRLQRFGPGEYEPVPLAILDGIRSLPPDAKIAYSCGPSEEISYWDPRLLSIGVHTNRRIIPMCFEADTFSPMVGAPATLHISPLFATAPQRTLYPDATAVPSATAVRAFLDNHRIDFLYEDSRHPNRLWPATTTLVEVGSFRLLQLRLGP